MSDEALRPLGIYIHVPFCRKKCEYCDFYSLGGARDPELVDRYVYAVQQHLKEAAPRAGDHLVDTVYFGGGTPSFLGADHLKRILDEIYRRYNVSPEAEITFEANPDSASLHTLRRLYRAGFNRVSLGIQSDQDETLKALGRPHNFQQAKQAVKDARTAGFSNVSVDLMFGLPRQTREGWADTLRSVADLRPDHISCYGLTVQPGTPLAEYAECANLPDDDTQADMYLFMVEALADLGFEQYEISNFCQEGRQCRHNLKYWTGGEYLGFGPAAASDFAGSRFTFVSDLDRYTNCILKGEGTILAENQTISPRERGGEYLMLRLRTTRGISQQEYKTFRLPFAPIHETLEEYARQGLAEQTPEGRWHFTPQGFLLSNQLIGRLLEEQERSNPINQLGGKTLG